MKIEATLRLPGELLWYGEGLELPDGFAVTGQGIGNLVLFYGGRRIGSLMNWPRADRSIETEVGDPEARHVLILATEVDCILEWESLVKAGNAMSDESNSTERNES